MRQLTCHLKGKGWPISLLLVSFFVTSLAHGFTQEFKERFEFVRQDGELVMVRDNSLSLGFSIDPLVEQIKSQLKREQALMAQKGDYYEEVQELFEDEVNLHSQKSSRNTELLVDSLKEVEKMDVEKIFNDPKFKEVINRFEGKMEEIMSQLDPRVLARLDDPSFFYKKHVTHQALKWGLDLAQRVLSSVPVLNTATYILVETERLIRERRLFHQNLLMHYLENYEDRLDLEAEDVNLIYSSIYESRIPWFAFWESNRAKANWETYGTDSFYSAFRQGSNKIRNYRHLYTRQGKRINFAFQKVTSNDGERLVVNLQDGDNMFNAKPAVAMNLDHPSKIVRKRILLQLGSLGVSFLSLPQWVKDMGKSYFDSFYENQRLTEGALFAHYEIQSYDDRQQDIVNQYLNPFDLNLQL